LSSIESLAKEERILKPSPRFAVVTDYKNLVARTFGGESGWEFQQFVNIV
jgi:hypothetical protein